MEKPGITNADKLPILIAEDNDSNFILFKVLLQRDYCLIHATNGLEAVQLFKKCAPCLILMDIKMPEMDGYEATQEIRKLSVSVPIIAVTAYAFPEDQERIMTSGFNDYLSKPVNGVVLKKKIAEWLNK